MIEFELVEDHKRVARPKRGKWGMVGLTRRDGKAERFSVTDHVFLEISISVGNFQV